MGGSLTDTDVAQQIGNTPLIKLKNLARSLPSGVLVLGKAEFMNPSGSVKDRAALAMIRHGEKTGRLASGKTILEATSGNTGIALAMLGAARGYQVTICLPKNASRERKNMLRAYGATLVETDPLQSSDGAQIKARELFEAEPERYFYPDQYNNEENWRAHYNGTALEIWRQTEGRVTHFVAGIGTSGTFIGTSRRLKELNPQVRCLAVHPDSPFHALEGLKHLETALVPGIYDPTVADEHLEIASEDAQDFARRLAREEGLFVGTSAGANVGVALRFAQNLPAGSVVVTILCDSGARYLSEEYFALSNED
ncbi:MAG: cysteine synthase family protein [Blastocatellia bacterium]|nr:cysteine synthase family protein [Blastocatellia bacterium]